MSRLPGGRYAAPCLGRRVGHTWLRGPGAIALGPSSSPGWAVPFQAVPLPLSGTQIDKLGRRLRDTMEVGEDDLVQLERLLLAYNDVLSEVDVRLRAIALRPTTRFKTSGAIVDKLRREAPITLRSIHDLAGARVVQSMTLTHQDRICDRIRTLWPDARVIDRRANPTHGYRAVHIVPRIDGCYVEIQVRTLHQDTWAEFTETLGDRWGRAVRYGGLPADPDAVVGPSGATRPS
jgi:hypothetical protein